MIRLLLGRITLRAPGDHYLGLRHFYAFTVTASATGRGVHCLAGHLAGWLLTFEWDAA